MLVQVLKNINYKSHAKVLCTFKLNGQGHDSVPLSWNMRIQET